MSEIGRSERPGRIDGPVSGPKWTKWTDPAPFAPVAARAVQPGVEPAETETRGGSALPDSDASNLRLPESEEHVKNKSAWKAPQHSYCW